MFRRKLPTISSGKPGKWNDKWPKAPVIYSGRVLRTGTERIGVDVKNFITVNDEIIKDVIKKYKLVKKTHDQTAHAIQKWVVKFLTYKYDEESNDCPEFWQFPFETLQSGIGDCEDGAILIASMCIQAGIPNYRLKVAAGMVQSAPTAPEGGHGYCIYLADDEQWRVLDWCYYEDSKKTMAKKPLAKDGGYKGCYKAVWFTFNNEYSWNQKALAVDGRLKAGSSAGRDTKEIMKDIEAKYKAK